MCHTRELAYQIKNEFARFTKYMPEVKTAAFIGGTKLQEDYDIIANKDTFPNVVVATPGRMNFLTREKKIRLNNIKVFVLDECDKMLDQIGMTPTPYCSLTSWLSRYYRHAPRRPRYLPSYANPKASHDV